MTASWARQDSVFDRRDRGYRTVPVSGSLGVELEPFTEPLTDWTEGLSALIELDRATYRMERAGTPVPCQTGDDPGALHLSEDPAERERAVALCQDCPLLTMCDTAARFGGYTFGVWGGKDRGPVFQEGQRVCERPGCEVGFWPKPLGRGRVQRFCSPDCRKAAWKSREVVDLIVMNCSLCSKPFSQPPRHGHPWTRCDECQPVRISTPRKASPWPVDENNCWVITCYRCHDTFTQPRRRARPKRLCQRCFDGFEAAGLLGKV